MDYNFENWDVEIKRLQDWNTKWSEVNGPVADFNNKGISHEQNGQINNALIEYEKCLKWIYENFDGNFMKNIAWHSPERLRILYKKLRHPNEKIFLEDFIIFCKSHEIDYPQIFDNQLNKMHL